MMFTIFRTYSRNTNRRAAENTRFIRGLKHIRNFFMLLRLRIKEAGRHRFRKCPKCRVIIRTSTGRGERELTCPKCGKVFKARIII